MNLIKDAKELKWIGILVFLCCFGVLNISCFMISRNTVIYDPIEIWIAGCDFMDFFIPLLVSAPFSITLYLKRKNNFLVYVSTRIEKRKYIRNQIIAGMMVASMIVFIAYFLALINSIYFFYSVSDGRSYIQEYVFGTIQAEHPIIFGLLWCIWKGIVISLFTGFGYMLALYVDNIFVVAIAPFIYVMAENLITGILEIPQYSIMTSYIVNRLSPERMHVWTFGVGVITFLIITSSLIAGIRKKRS